MACTWDFSFLWASPWWIAFPSPVWWCYPSVDVSLHGVRTPWVLLCGCSVQRAAEENQVTSECLGWSIRNEWNSPVFQSSLPVSIWIQADAGVWMKSQAQAVSSPWTGAALWQHAWKGRCVIPLAPVHLSFGIPCSGLILCVPLARGVGSWLHLCLGGWESWLHLGHQATRMTQVAVIQMCTNRGIWPPNTSEHSIGQPLMKPSQPRKSCAR